MTYKEIRDKFVEVSGRYDLVTSTGADNGADFLLNAGQRYLDRVHKHAKAEARNVQLLSAGSIKVYITGLRSVKEVWYNKADGTSMLPLALETLSAIREYYGKKLSTETAGTPAYYAPVSFRPFPDTVTSTTWTGYQDIEDLILDDAHYTQNGIIVMPAPDADCYISTVGLFYSPVLSATYAGGVWVCTKSFWTENHPDTLIASAIMKMHSLYLNTAGAADYKIIVSGDIKGLDDDNVENDIAGPSQMRG